MWISLSCEENHLVYKLPSCLIDCYYYHHHDHRHHHHHQSITRTAEQRPPLDRQNEQQLATCIHRLCSTLMIVRGLLTLCLPVRFGSVRFALRSTVLAIIIFNLRVDVLHKQCLRWKQHKYPVIFITVTFCESLYF